LQGVQPGKHYDRGLERAFARRRDLHFDFLAIADERDRKASRADDPDHHLRPLHAEDAFGADFKAQNPNEPGSNSQVALLRRRVSGQLGDTASVKTLA
jgi:hypothetical protein